MKLNDLKVRPMKPAEASSVVSLFQAVVAQLHYYNSVARKHEIELYSPAHLRNKIKIDKYSVLVAFDEKRIVGFCFSRWDNYTVYLEWFGVAPDNRRTGVGRALLAALEKSLRYRQAHKVWCNSRTSNVESRNALSSSGYKIIGTVRDHWFHQDFVLWHKLIR